MANLSLRSAEVGEAKALTSKLIMLTSLHTTHEFTNKYLPLSLQKTEKYGKSIVVNAFLPTFYRSITSSKEHMKEKIAIIGLGYVGLPLARLFATKFPVVGFDINQKRIDELNAGHDFTLEVEEGLLRSVLVSQNPVVGESGTTGLYCTKELSDITRHRKRHT